MIEGLRNRDAALWSSDPAVQHGIADRLGWLDAAAFMDANGRRILDFAQRIRTEGYQQAVLLGMGGSSLAPEVYASLYGGGSRSLPVIVLDSTSPGHIRTVTAQCDHRRTLFIVSSKSGTTAETAALDAHFHEWARTRFDRPQDHFIAITDPGSPLEALASERGYREIFLNPADVGGRFSALSYFGLVPAVLSGVDLPALRARLPDIDPASPLVSAACRLGLALGALAGTGRNKLTLQLSPGLAALAPWIEQLVDESTGKQGQGILVVPEEPCLAPGRYGDDRVFALVELEGETLDPSWVGGLAACGHPLAHWRVADTDSVGAEFLRWEIATATAGRVLGINPFDEPDVNDTKTATRRMLEQGDGAPSAGDAAAPGLEELVAAASPGDYLAILAYLPPSPDNRRRLSERCGGLARRTGLPCTAAFGPRYLHSSGQLHKGGPNQGIFVIITGGGEDLPIPGQRHGFRALIRSQALADLQVLRERGRRVVHLEAGGTGDALAAILKRIPG